MSQISKRFISKTKHSVGTNIFPAISNTKRKALQDQFRILITSRENDLSDEIAQ